MGDLVSLAREKDELSGHDFLVSAQIPAVPRGVMVFIHGAAGYAEYLASAMSYFAERDFVTFAPDIVGHGERAHIDMRHMSVLDYVSDMREFIERIVRIRYPAQKIILVGHSMGGLIVQKLAEEGVGDALVLLTPAPPHGVMYLPGEILVPSLSDIGSALALVFGGRPFKPSRKLIARFFADPVASAPMIDAWCGTRISGESLVALRELGLSQIKVDPDAITAPMLVIGAGKDVVIHRHVTKKIAAHYDADHEEVPHLGHMCIFESGWEDVARVMEKWLNNNV